MKYQGLPRDGKNYCAVAGCSSYRYDVSGTSFFKIFSSKREKVDEWVEFCQNPSISRNSVICGRHFQKADFCNPDSSGSRLRLHLSVRPTRYPPASIMDIKPENHENEVCQTTSLVKNEANCIPNDGVHDLKLEIKIEPPEVNF